MAMLAGIQGASGVQETTFGSKFGKLPAGGYVCKILNVKVDKTSGGSLYIKLQIDVSEGEYAGHFQRRTTLAVSTGKNGRAFIKSFFRS